MGHQKARVCGPWVDCETAFPTHARHIGSIEYREGETKACLHLVVPLLEHGGRAGDDNPIDPSAQQQLSGDESGLHGLAEAHIVGDEEINARQSQRLAQRVELICVDPNACAKRCLKEARIGRRHAVPRQGAQVRGEQGGIVEAFLGDRRPAVVVEHASVEFVLPQD